MVPLRRAYVWLRTAPFSVLRRGITWILKVVAPVTLRTSEDFGLPTIDGVGVGLDFALTENR